MPLECLRIATRRSELAMWQANHAARLLRARHPRLAVEVVGMSTRGDQIQDRPLAQVGGKALFVKALEQAISDGRADIAVHSMKDVPAEMPPAFHVPVIMARDTPFDAFVSNHFARAGELPAGARVGTASLRRECQLRARRPDLRVETLRGNVQTRLGKLDAGEFDAIVLAAAGLQRLDLDERITALMPAEESLPAVGQGALGIECRRDAAEINTLIADLAERDATDCVTAERAVNARLEGSCHVPIAAYAMLEADTLWLRALVGSPDGGEVLRAEARGPRAEAATLGHRVAGELLEKGAAELLARL